MNKTKQTKKEDVWIKGVGKPAINAFAFHIAVTKPEQLVKYTEADLLKLHGVGPKSIRIIKEYFKTKGLRPSQNCHLESNKI